MAFQNFKTLFNNLQDKRRKAREVEACKKAAITAIVTRDPEGLRKALGATQSGEISGEMMCAAIEGGDLKTFQQLLAVMEPNTILQRTTYIRTIGGWSPCRENVNPLNYALKVRSHDIALALAADPRTNIETRPGTETPLVAALQAGMPDVAAVLAQRTAELCRQEAAQLDKEAAALLENAEPSRPPSVPKTKLNL